MSLLRSFNIGYAGLRAAGNGMDVIGDNIANAGTFGFKSSRAEFQDVLAGTLKGIAGEPQIGAGSRLANIKQMMSQGDIARTDSVTDLAINGDGFFMVDAPFGRGFTRDGSFNFDKEGILVTSDGYPLVGFSVDKNGTVTSKLDKIQLGSATLPAAASDEVKLSMNLDSRSKVKKFDIKDPENTSNYSSSITVYDNIGMPRVVTLHYNKTENNNWEYHAVVEGKDVEGGDATKIYEMASGKLKFDSQGVLQEEISDENSFDFNNGAAQGQKIKFNWGESLSEGGTGLDSSTQFGSNSTVARHTQDGYSAGTLTSLSFNDNGILTAVYDNGESKDISQMSIGKFENNEGLFKVGKNLFKESKKSGQVAAGKPGEAGRGGVIAKSIELSNVDIANEFVNLMETQRNFTANAKTLTTADEMLQEVLAIKR